MSSHKYMRVMILLIFIILAMGSTAISARIDPVDHQVIYLPFIEKINNWTEECIDCPHSFWGRSLSGAQLDSSGRIHVAYGGEQLYYGHQDGDGQWAIQVVDEELHTGVGSSLGLDSADRPHIIYRDDFNKNWKYAFQTENGWQIEDLPILSDGDSEATIVIDSADNPHIAYTSNVNGMELHYSYRDADDWQTVVVDTNTSDISLALDSLGHPHLAYHDSVNNRLLYAIFDGIEWSTTVIGEPEDHGYGTSIILDTGDNPHITFLGVDIAQGYQQDALKYAYQIASDWQVETVDTRGALDWESSVKLDQAGTPYIVYTDLEYDCPRGHCYSQLLNAYRHITGEWIVDNVADGSHYCLDDGTLLIDAIDRLHVICRSGAQLRAAIKDPDWALTSIDVSEEVYGRSELVIDSGNMFHTSYLKGSRAIYAVKEGHEWQIEYSGPATDLANHTGLAFGPDNEIYFAYPSIVWVGPVFYVYTFLLAKRTEAGWITEEMWGVGHVDSFDIEVDSQGGVHLSAVGSNGLRYWLEPTLDPYEPTIVDPEPGEFTAMVLDANGWPCIAYDPGVKYACKTENEWQITMADEKNAYSISLVLDSAGRPHVSYFDDTHEIKHAYFDGDDWQIEPVARIIGFDDHFGSILSMVIDGQDRLHLSYPDGWNDVIHAYRGDAGWHFENIATSGNVTGPTAIALDSQDNPHIAYTDGMLRDLRIIHYRP